MIPTRRVRPGVASLALLFVLLVTTAWWALALWPAGAVEPAWLLKTRAVCFGSAPGGLPDAGGWVLLVGEPFGMLAALFLVWGGNLREDLGRLWPRPAWRVAMIAVAALLTAGVVAAGRRVAFAAGLGVTLAAPDPGVPHRVDIDASAVVLVDQHGRLTSLLNLSPDRALLTFAFGHCATVCPAVVHDLLAARRQAGRLDIPLVVVSLDPWRDTPERLSTMAAEWRLAPADLVLSADVAGVERALDLLRIGRRRDERTGDIQHAGTVMVLDRRGHAVWRLDGGWGRVPELLASDAMPWSDGR